MKRTLRLIALFLVFALTAGTMASAAEYRAGQAWVELSFSDGNANCNCIIFSMEKEIEVTLELWSGGKLLDSWTNSGETRVSISETYPATSGKAYTLKSYGTVGGTDYTWQPIVKICP